MNEYSSLTLQKQRCNSKPLEVQYYTVHTFFPAHENYFSSLLVLDSGPVWDGAVEDFGKDRHHPQIVPGELRQNQTYKQ